MELDFLVTCADEMVDDVGSSTATTGTTEPFIAGETLDDGGGRMDTAVPRE